MEWWKREQASGNALMSENTSVAPAADGQAARQQQVANPKGL